MAKKQVIRLTESDLHEIIKESVNKILTETDHGVVQNTFDNGKVNPKKTPEQVAAQKQRITDKFNKMYGSNEEGNQIQYDFNPNQKYYKGYGDYNKVNPNGNYVYNRSEWGHTGNGGVTINGQRYTTASVDDRYLPRFHNPNDNDEWDYYASTYNSKPGVMDANKKLVNPQQFNQKQLDALNNVHNTYQVNRDFMGKNYVNRGGTPFKKQ